MNQEEKSTDVSETKYENRVCAFIDILGFSRMVEDESSWSPSRIIEMLGEMEKIPDEYEQTFGHVNKQVTHFSDSIIISIKCVDNDSLYHALYQMIVLVNGLLRAATCTGVLLRGGVTFGKMFHNDKHAFGPAFIRAYKLEQEAKYPRIIFDWELSDRIFEADISQASKADVVYISSLRTHLPEDTDRWRYVGSPLPKRREIENLKELIKNHKESNDLSIRSKYGWLEIAVEISEKKIEKLEFTEQQREEFIKCFSGMLKYISENELKEIFNNSLEKSIKIMVDSFPEVLSGYISMRSPDSLEMIKKIMINIFPEELFEYFSKRSLNS
jgi:hypothetical protein